MRVVHVINRLGPGGAERQLLGLVERSMLDHEVIELHGPGRGTPLELLSGLRGRLVSQRADLIVAWLDRSQMAVAAVAPRRSRLVASIRGLPRPHRQRQVWMLRAALSRYHATVMNSEASRAAWLDFIRPGRLHDSTVIPNGTVLPEAAQTVRRPEGPLHVGFLGRANADKGVDLLLEALTHLEGLAVEATMIGTDVPAAVTSAGAAEASIRGLPNQADPWTALGEVDVLAVPSRSEGSPNVVLEAFARGVPVVATTAGGAEELVQGGRGLLVAPGDSRGIAEALREVARDPLAARERARAARMYVERNYAWGGVVARWDEVLSTQARTPC